jgi:hypothetical protein
VYVIGAGLTKSLELPGRRVPLLNDFVSVIADYIDDDAVLTAICILETGRVFEWTCDEWQALAQESGAGKRTAKTREAYRTILKSRPSENIETLLQRSLTQRNVYAQSAPQRFNFAINKVFSQIGWNLDCCPLNSFLKRQFSLENTDHTFISFNYDLVLDRSVQTQSNGQWQVQSDYGFNVDYFIDNQEASLHMGQFPEHRQGAQSFSLLQLHSLTVASGEQYDGRFKIIKPHGSLNWLARYEENYEYRDDAPFLCLDTDHGITYYPLFDCDHIELPDGSPCRGTALFVVPPTESKPAKLDFLRALRRQEHEAFQRADEAYIIGWSMPETDEDQRCLISTAIRDRDKEIEQVTVINYGAPQAYYDRIMRLFAVDRTRLRIDNAGFRSYAATN